MPRPFVQHEVCTLTCLISCFIPKDIKIIWYKEHNGKQHQVAEARFKKGTHNAEELRERSKYTHSISEVSFADCVSSMLKFKPTILEHHGSVFTCKTVHESTKHEATSEAKLEVTAVPVLNPIQHVRSSEGQITLECKIHSFFPKDIEIFWWKDGVRLEPENNDIKSELDLFYCITKFTFIPSQKDQGKRVTCSINTHKSLMEPKEVSWNMIPIVVTPRISEIISDPVCPVLGKRVTLSCAMEEFFPEKCTVMWQIGDDVRHSKCEINEGNPVLNPETGLFNNKTSITFEARREDHGKQISVSVLHYATMVTPARKQLHFLLKGVPRVSDIIFEPQFFGYGQPISLTCDVTGFHPNDITAAWYNNGMKMKNITNVASDKDEDGLYSLKTSLNFRPTALDYNTDISLLVNHPSFREPIKKQVRISLPALPPTVSEFEMTPSKPEANKTLTLRVFINDYAPRYIQVRWFTSNSCFEEKVSSSEPQIGKNGLCFSESQVQFIPRMSDHNCQLRCEVVHPASGRVTEKSCTLMLKGVTVYSDSSLYDTDGPSRHTNEQLVPPEETEALKIKCVTNSPKAGEDVILSCKLPGYLSDDTDIYWYKGMYPVNSRNIRNEKLEEGCISYVTIETNEAERECNIRCELINEEPRSMLHSEAHLNLCSRITLL